MKQFLLGLSVSLAFIAGCVTATVAQTAAVPEARAAAPGVQRWESKCPSIAKLDQRVVADWNAYGAEGWEMITNSRHCFKRPLPSAT